MFITALAPNTMAIAMITKAINVTIPWTLWFKGFLPVGIILTLIQPALLYVIYPPQIKDAPAAPRWAAEQLKTMGVMTRQEITMLLLVLGALGFWIGGASYIDPAIVSAFVILGMVIFRVVSWDDIVGHSQAWNTLIWFATLVAMAGGLAETKFLDWLAESLVPMLSGLSPYATIAGVVLAFFFLHYFFASITAHTATLFPLFLAVAIKIPVVSPVAWALLLAYPLGMIGILTPYASGQNAVYYGSGFIKRRDFWVLGFILGVVYTTVYLAIIVKWLGTSVSSVSGEDSSGAVTRRLAQVLATTRYNDLPIDVVEYARRAVIDWFGSALAGSIEKPARLAQKVAAGFGASSDATMFSAGRGSAPAAAFANGVASHILELDDIHRGSTIHAAAPIIPAALAVAEREHADGRRFLAAVTIGYEAAFRIGEAVNPSHYYFFHPTGTVATFGAAAAAGSLLGLNTDQMLDALGSAGTQAAALWEFNADGAMSKHLHPGKAAMNGVLAADLARIGFTGATRILEGERGFFRAMSTVV